jgi:hypothetical protein
MADRAMRVYLNDHLAGAILGSALAEQIRDRAKGTPLGEVMESIAAEIEEDRQTLLNLMRRMGTRKNPIKQATGRIAELASRVKFSGLLSGEPEHGAFLALESLTLGVAGKACLWTALKKVSGTYPLLSPADLDALIDRAESQHSVLERERIAAGRRALANCSDKSRDPGH